MKVNLSTSIYKWHICRFLKQTSMDSMHFASVTFHAECGQNNFDLVNNALSRERSRNSALGASQGVDNAGDEIDSDDDEEIGICLFPLFSFLLFFFWCLVYALPFRIIYYHVVFALL